MIRTEPTYTIDLFMAGDIAQAKQVCREFCFAVGFCVHIHAANFIYTGGEEAGFKVGIVNYPRFPAEPEALWARARDLAEALVNRLCQHSVLLVAPDRTEWITRHPRDVGGAA